MARFELDGKAKGGTDSEEFHKCMRDEVGPVECHVCKTKFFQGNKGQALEVCKECFEYVCSDHIYRHPNCERGR